MITTNELAILHKHGTDDVKALVAEVRRLKRALTKERHHVVTYIRDCGENECGLSQLDCDLLAERIESGYHVPKEAQATSNTAE